MSLWVSDFENIPIDHAYHWYPNWSLERRPAHLQQSATQLADRQVSATVLLVSLTTEAVEETMVPQLTESNPTPNTPNWRANPEERRLEPLLYTEVIYRELADALSQKRVVCLSRTQYTLAMVPSRRWSNKPYECPSQIGQAGLRHANNRRRIPQRQIEPGT